MSTTTGQVIAVIPGAGNSPSFVTFEFLGTKRTALVPPRVTPAVGAELLLRELEGGEIEIVGVEP